MDKARKTTDKKLAQMERKVNKIYKEAYDDISKDWVKYMDSHAPKLQNAYDDLQNALASGDRAAIKEAKEHYEHTAMNITVNNKRFQGMVEDVSAKITHTNEVALAYVNDQVPEIYTINYNAFKNEHIKGYTFSLVNEQAVKNLAKTDKTLLPTKKIDVPKDMQWNQKLINSQMTQGILQGESIPKMAKRLRNVTDMDRVASIRNARTMTTSAENKGRHDSYKKATDDGIILKRVWIATHDPPRVRDWHLALDGVEVDVDEPWENKYGQLMYPADPNGEPCNVYNCRCAMRVRVVGFKWNKTPMGTGKPTLDGLVKPERPSKDAYSDYDDFQKARETYKVQKEEYNAKVDEWVKNSMSTEMSINDFTTWCDNSGVKIYGDISSVDGRALTAYTERMDKLFKDFPEVKDYRKAYKDLAEQYTHYEFAYENTASFVAEANHGFTFGSAGKDMDYLLREQADAVASGFRTLGDGTINQLFDHEYGHNVYDWMKHMEDRSEEGFQRRVKLEKDLISSVYNKNGCSEYSSTNADELFAEGFSAWYGGEKTEFANAMGDFLKRWGVIK